MTDIRCRSGPDWPDGVPRRARVGVGPDEWAARRGPGGGGAAGGRPHTPTSRSRPHCCAGKAAAAGFEALLDREEAERSRPLGRALDLGCGRGLHTHELAERGWEATGVDDVPRAIDAATRNGTSGATFVVGDVTDLAASGLGPHDFFLDVGCFHGLGPEQRLAVGRGASSLANPGATLLMLAFRPTGMRFIPGGVTRADVEAAFPAWELLSVEAADTTGMPRPLKETEPQWYRLRRQDR